MADRNAKAKSKRKRREDPVKALTSKQLRQKRDYLAPDGSEIRLLVTARRGGLAHCTLPARGVSMAVRHRKVEEIWYCLSGQGEVWRGAIDKSIVTKIRGEPA